MYQIWTSSGKIAAMSPFGAEVQLNYTQMVKIPWLYARSSGKYYAEVME